ncbi:phosphoribosylanthranilate isomerase [Tissierella pigra]|uniref:N-(5'-phosphoribosyl)anthranilate isomerase n=1 Tax=Tissierella pigra TaxID=2607614 RepID=A0A6N7XVJ4_9FIRM|nr:phosphoribosylanthranilate isomerase [Tissierella pigra]MBU5427983.1 phosphoribosylanthranilate isomerase [Tissierella pigra]MSU00564.1 phosphoribosylanthranilate isomerase [Tissierella pigra]
MVEIKICGLRRYEDVDYVNKLKPEYIGFVFAKSKRQIDFYMARRLANSLNKDIKKVGIFLNHSIREVKEIEKLCNLDVLQFHGDESPSYCNCFENEVWKSFLIKDEKSLGLLEKYNVDKYLLDTWIEGEVGGTGKKFNWELAKEITKTKSIVLAGGLCSENIKNAIQIVRPTVVDVSSGVETDGYKDYGKIKDFIKKVRG